MENKLPVIWEPIRYENRWVATVKCTYRSDDGLSPLARAEMTLALYKQVRKLRDGVSLWIIIKGPMGSWYLNSVKDELRKHDLPICVTTADQIPLLTDFNRWPALYPRKPMVPQFDAQVFDETQLLSRQRAKLQVVRSLAHMGVAKLAEIASMSGYSKSYLNKLLPELSSEGYINLYNGGNTKDPLWEIRMSGIQYAHLSWQVPVMANFKALRTEQRYAGRRHRSTARLWRNWLRKSFGTRYKIWQSWTEISLGDIYPDALAWGMFDGFETLAWLEVESGKKSGKRTVRDIVYRYNKAREIARSHNVKLIFVVLSQPWVLKELQNDGLFVIPWDVALIFENWRNKFCLAKPNFGSFNTFFPDAGFPFIKDLHKRLKENPYWFRPKFRKEVVDELIAKHSEWLNGMNFFGLQND